MSQHVQQIAEEVNKLSPAGRAIVVETLGALNDTGGANPTAASMLNLESLIKNHIKGVEDLAQEIKLKREMFNDSFNNNPNYREHDEKVKEASKAKASVKLEIIKQPSVARLDQELKDLAFDLKEKRKTLSDLLLDYKEQTGATQLELFDGRTMEIVQSAKVVRAK